MKGSCETATRALANGFKPGLPMPEKFEPYDDDRQIEGQREVDCPAHPESPFEISQGNQRECEHGQFAGQKEMVKTAIRCDGSLAEPWVQVREAEERHPEYDQSSPC